MVVIFHARLVVTSARLLNFTFMLICQLLARASSVSSTCINSMVFW